ncbi:MAG: SpoIIE family protein phosphatase [Turicibacter sp.]|nr:SpoIIE family protein phosphatase [Turicibacter sp.]
MGFTEKVKASLTTKQDGPGATSSRGQLNKYMLSHFFVQLVNLQQLIKAMNEFIGDGKFVKTATLFESVTLCLNKMMQEMVNDRYDLEQQAKLIQTSLAKLGISANDIKIKSLYPRLLKLSLMVNKPSPSLLNGQLKEELEAIFNEALKINIGKVRSRNMKIDVLSSRNFKLEHGVSYVGKGGSKVSGDSYLYENFQNGKTMIAISDGMGNGALAREESRLALQVLKCMLNFDVPVTDAIRVLAELKQQANTDERFFSLDLCLVDKENRKAHFYKQAATTTFLLRNEVVRRIEMSGLPIGATVASEIDQMSIDLQIGDIIIMCSDGIVDTFSEGNLFEKRILKNTGYRMDRISQDLLDYTVRRNRGEINDDMMIVAAVYKPAR